MSTRVQAGQQQEVAWGPTKSLKPGIAWGRVCLYLLLAVSVVFFVVVSLNIDVFAAGVSDGCVVPAFICGASAPAWILLGFLRKVWAFMTYGTLVLAILLLSLLSWHPRHHFVDTLYSIQVGSSKEEVFEIMSPYLDKTPWLDAPREVVHEKGSTLSFRWCDSGWRHNAGMGMVYLQGGKVSGTKFLRD